MAIQAATILQAAIDRAMKKDASQSLEELIRYYGWDEALSQSLRSLPRQVVEYYILEARNYDRDGWRYILPELSPSASILCLDTRFGNTAAAFAETGVSVTVIHYCPVMVRIIQHQLATMSVPNVKVIQVAPKAGKLPFADQSFDAFICHDVGGVLGMEHATDSDLLAAPTAALFTEVYRITKLNGFAYFGLKNRFGYDTIKKKLFPNLEWSNKLAPCGIWMRRITRLIERVGFQNLQIYPYLLGRGRVSEIVPNTGYQSVKNTFAVIEKIKQIVLGKIGIKYLAPAYGLVCVKDYLLHSNQILGFAKNLVAQKILNTLPKTQPYFQRYLSLPGKVFVTFGKANNDSRNIIIIIPTMPIALHWRRREIAIVNELRALSPYLASKLPSLYCELSWRGETYFALSEIPGITIDRRVPHLDRLTRRAVEFLIQFNQITARNIVIDETFYMDSVGGLIWQATNAYPMIRSIMARIENLLHAICISKPISVVWFHGDYKLENLIIDKDTLEISGIIDWEQSRCNGLPWLDLLYLLTYNRIMTEGRDFFDVYHKVIAAQNFTNSEKRLIDAYNSAMPMALELKPILTCLFFIHHIGCRIKYDMRIEGWRIKIFDGLEKIEKLLICG